MRFAKLINVLRAFDEKQMDKLKDYLDSPYFNVIPSAVALYRHFYKYYPRFTENKLSESSIAKNNTLLSNSKTQAWAATVLLKHVENFIAQEKWLSSHKFNREWYKLSGMQDLCLTQESAKIYDSVMAELEVIEMDGIERFDYRHRFIELSLSDVEAIHRRRFSEGVAPVVNSLDQFYALKKLRYHCEMLYRQQLFSVKYSAPFLDELFQTLRPYSNEKYPYVYLFINVYRMLDGDSYYECSLYISIIKKYIGEIGGDLPGYAWEVVDYVANTCLQWFNNGFTSAGEEYLWWLDLRVQNDRLLHHGKILPTTYRNVVNIAVVINKNPSWLGNFINSYGPLLPEEHKESTLNFVRGLQKYSLKDYKEALRYFLLAQAKEEVIFNCRIRYWQWICAYEYDKEDIDSLQNQLLAFEKFTFRNKDELKHLSLVFNKFISYAGKLLTIQSNELKMVADEVNNSEHFAGKPWLLTQLNLRAIATTRNTLVKIN